MTSTHPDDANPNIDPYTANRDHGKLGCVYAVTITAMSILLLREGNFQVLVILK